MNLYPPLKSFCKQKTNFLIILSILFLHSCDPPSEKGKTYTTTVSGKIITPARAADPTKGGTIGTATVWADPAKKVAANPDGSYRLKVAHSGSFTLTADYTGTDGNYKASAPKTFNTSAEKIDNQNIALQYGHTVNFIGRVIYYPSGIMGGSGRSQNGATVTVEVEGVEVDRDQTKTIRGIAGSYSLNVNHNGHVTVKASYNGMTDSVTHNVGNRATFGGSGVGMLELEP